MISHAPNCYCKDYDKLSPGDVIDVIKSDNEHTHKQLKDCEMDTLADIIANRNHDGSFIYEWSEFTNSHRDLMFRAAYDIFQVEHLISWIMTNEVTMDELNLIKNRAVILKKDSEVIHDFTVFLHRNYFDVEKDYKDFLCANLLGENFYKSLNDGAELGIII